MVHKFVDPYLFNLYAKMMHKKETIQEHNYIELKKTIINNIHSRYVAFKLAELEVEVESVKRLKDLEYIILCNKGSYLVTLPNIPIPDAKIELM